jgi:hypothetical protein
MYLAPFVEPQANDLSHALTEKIVCTDTTIYRERQKNGTNVALSFLDQRIRLLVRLACPWMTARLALLRIVAVNYLLVLHRTFAFLLFMSLPSESV